MGRLTCDDMRRFANDGYLVIPNVVSESLLAAVDREIDGLVDRVSIGLLPSQCSPACC
jgi:hypothetical protein